MAMQTDVKASAPLTTTGSFTDSGATALGPLRIKALYCVCSTGAGSVVITNGNGGATLANISTPTAANAGSIYLILPGEGIQATIGAYGTVTNTTSTVLFYG
jgi:hypothetical protein